MAFAQLHGCDVLNGASMVRIEDARLFEAQHFPSAQADLIVFEKGREVSFSMRRVFTIHAHEAVERGRHAHRECKQVMICLAGACEVVVDDGNERKTVLLSDPHMALYVPPSIWAEQSYSEPGTILMVLCDQTYDSADYIRDYDDFLTYRSAGS